MTLQKEFLKGLWRENPTFRLVLGMCPTLAVTTSAENGIGMGLATTFVLVCSNLFISLLRRFIPSKVRIPAFIVIIASFVTLVDISGSTNIYFSDEKKQEDYAERFVDSLSPEEVQFCLNYLKPKHKCY